MLPPKYFPSHDKLIRINFFPDPDADGPNLSAISLTETFRIKLAIIENLNLSLESQGDEDWDQITQLAIESHADQVKQKEKKIFTRVIFYFLFSDSAPPASSQGHHRPLSENPTEGGNHSCSRDGED